MAFPITQVAERYVPDIIQGGMEIVQVAGQELVRRGGVPEDVYATPSEDPDLIDLAYALVQMWMEPAPARVKTKLKYRNKAYRSCAFKHYQYWPRFKVLV